MLELTDVLRGGRQCDEDGVEIIMSREASRLTAGLGVFPDRRHKQ